MTKRRPSNLDAGLMRRRHRRLPTSPARDPSKLRARRILIAGTTALVAAAAVLGYAAEEPGAALPLPAAQLPLGSVGAESPVGSESSSSGGPGAGPSSSPPAPSRSASPAATPLPAPTSAPPPPSVPPPPAEPPGATKAPATTAPPPPATTRPPAAPAPATPRLVGPTSLAGFDSFLDAYCEKRGFRGALLLNGRRTPTTGRWICARFAKVDTIDLNDACQDTFGTKARARAQVDGDIRTVRCFDS